MERILSAVKRNISFAANRVFRGAREFACFFAALFIIQTALCLVAFSYDSTLVSRSGGRTEDKEWHLCYVGLNSSQKSFLVGYRPPRGGMDVFDTAFYDKRTVDGEEVYDIYLRFTERDLIHAREVLASNAERYLGAFGEQGGYVSVRYSPEYRLYVKWKETAPVAVGGFAAAFGVSLLFLAILYGIRTRQERFVFGVYISWGADTRRLALSSGLELAVCAAVTYLPAAVCGALLAYYCSSLAGGTFYLTLRLALLVLPCVCLASFGAAYLRTRAMSLVQPTELLAAKESADLASSPRRSSLGVRNAFPKNYELLSLWRFRKFILSTGVSFALCAAAFFFAVTCAGALEKSRDYMSEYGSEYVLVLENGEDHEIAVKGLKDIKGVAHVSETVPEQDARYYSHLISMESSSVKKKGIAAANPYLDGHSLTDYFRLCACDAATAASLADVYTVEGDITTFSGGYDVIVGETAENDRAFRFRPGDKLTLWIYVNSRGTVEEGSTGVYKISQMAEQYIYKTVELNVVAVVKDAPSPNTGFALYVSDELFSQVTGEIPVHNSLSISLAENAEQLNTVQNIRLLNDAWALGALEYVGEQTQNAENSAEGWAEMLICAGFTLIAISLLPLAYSLALFYRKRAGEMSVLRAMFAPNSSIVKMHIWDIPVFFGVCAAVTLPLCFASVWGASVFCDRVLPNIFFADMPIISQSKADPMLFVIIFVAALLCISLACSVMCLIAVREEKTERNKKLYTE